MGLIRIPPEVDIPLADGTGEEFERARPTERRLLGAIEQIPVAVLAGIAAGEEARDGPAGVTEYGFDTLAVREDVV